MLKLYDHPLLGFQLSFGTVNESGRLEVKPLLNLSLWIKIININIIIDINIILASRIACHPLNLELQAAQTSFNPSSPKNLLRSLSKVWASTYDLNF